MCSETPRAAGHADHQVLALDRLREEVAQDNAPQQADVARAAGLHTQTPSSESAHHAEHERARHRGEGGTHLAERDEMG